MIEKDYRFLDEQGSETGLVNLFGEHDTLVAYFWMFGPQRNRPCPMCTNWLGAVNGNAADIKQRVALKIIGRSPVERQFLFAQERQWRDLDFVQTVGDDYARDLGLINDDGTENLFQGEGTLTAEGASPLDGRGWNIIRSQVGRPPQAEDRPPHRLEGRCQDGSHRQFFW